MSDSKSIQVVRFILRASPSVSWKSGDSPTDKWQLDVQAAFKHTCFTMHSYQTWNCCRVMVVGAQDGSTLTTRCWQRSAVTTAASSADDVGGFSLKKSVRMRSTCASHSRRRRSILSRIWFQATCCLSLNSCALTLPVDVMSSAGCRWATGADDCDTTLVELVLAWPGHDRGTSASTVSVDWMDGADVGKNATEFDGVENPLEAPAAGNTTNESIWSWFWCFPAIKTCYV